MIDYLFYVSLIWNFLDSKIFVAFLSAIITLYVVEVAKKKSKKLMLLNVLYHELKMYHKPLSTHTPDIYQLPCRDKLIWSLLTSDALDSKNDKDLINSLYELAGWIENFNYTNNYANQAFASNKDLSFFNNGRCELYKGAYREKEKLEKLLREKYKIANK